MSRFSTSILLASSSPSSFSSAFSKFSISFTSSYCSPPFLYKCFNHLSFAWITQWLPTAASCSTFSFGTIFCGGKSAPFWLSTVTRSQFLWTFCGKSAGYWGKYRPPSVVVVSQVPSLILVVFLVCLVCWKCYFLLFWHFTRQRRVISWRERVQVAHFRPWKHFVVNVWWKGITPQPETNMAVHRSL